MSQPGFVSMDSRAPIASENTILDETLAKLEEHERRNDSKLANKLKFNRRLYWANDDIMPQPIYGDPFTLLPRIPQPFLTDPIFMAEQSIAPDQKGRPGKLASLVEIKQNPLRFNMGKPMTNVGIVDNEVIKLGATMAYDKNYY